MEEATKFRWSVDHAAYQTLAAQSGRGNRGRGIISPTNSEYHAYTLLNHLQIHKALTIHTEQLNRCRI